MKLGILKDSQSIIENTNLQESKHIDEYVFNVSKLIFNLCSIESNKIKIFFLIFTQKEWHLYIISKTCDHPEELKCGKRIQSTCLMKPNYHGTRHGKAKQTVECDQC